MRKYLRSNSIKTILFRYAALFIIPIIILLIISNLYAIHLVRNQVYSYNKNTLYLYISQIDKLFDEVENALSESAMNNSYLHVMGTEQDGNTRALASYQIEALLKRVSQSYGMMDGFFAFASPSDTYVSYEKTYQEYEQREQIEEYITQTIQNVHFSDNPMMNAWFSHRIGQDNFIFRIFHSQNAYIGAWVKAENLVSNLTTINISGLDYILLVDRNGNALTSVEEMQREKVDLKKEYDQYYLTGEQNKYLVIGQASGMGSFNLVALIRDNSVVEGLNNFSVIIITFIAISALLLLLYLNFSRKKVINPIRSLVEGMQSIESGNLDAKLQIENPTEEFAILSNTFNSMSAQIKNLKINIYEERIRNQKARLDFYQIQINPHFFINTLNTIYSFAQTNNCAMVQEMVLCLVRHFRYTLYNDPTVKLQEEMDFVKNYLHMQEIHTMNRLTHVIDFDISPSLMDADVPTLIIQTFVENAIKHNKTIDNQIIIKISASLEDVEGESYLHIVITDSGQGFSQEVCQILNEGGKLKDSRGKHIGIYNIQQRLFLLYGEKASLVFSNNHKGGACVDICFPARGEMT